MKYDASFFLRLGLAFVFLYASISAFLDPQSWVGYVPGFLGNDVTRGYVLLAHDFIGLGLGVWLLSGKKTFYSALLACASLAGITLTNLSIFVVVFRDVGLFFAAVALAVLSKKK